MKLRVLLTSLILVSTVLSSCGDYDMTFVPKREVITYSEKTLKLEHPLELEIVSNSSNIEVYTWDKNELKFEITKRIRGIEEKETQEKKLENLNISIKQDDGKVFLKTKFKGSIKIYEERSIDLKIFTPKLIKSMSYDINNGNIKFFDDISCELKMKVNKANINMNMFEGIICLTGDMCNLSVANGKIKANSNVKINMGNISIKSSFENDENYDFETSLGNIDLFLPSDSSLSVESIGTEEINEFTSNFSNNRIRAKSKMGKISVKKY